MKIIYIAYNKPSGIICTTEKVAGNIIDAINYPDKIIPIGRLDKDSQGLILLTNNKSIINKIIHPDFEHEKEYIVTLNLPLRNKFLKDMAAGVSIGGEITLPCKIMAVPASRRIFSIVLKQGLNRQIRRMCHAFNYQVIKLERVRIMNIKLEKLKPGEWRYLSEAELSELVSQLK